jgi:hypothetical protein
MRNAGKTTPSLEIDMTVADPDDVKILAALRSDPSLKACMLEMIDTTNDARGHLQTGDQAEDAVVNILQKTGSVLLHKWINNKVVESEVEAAADENMRPHEKKTSAGIPR